MLDKKKGVRIEETSLAHSNSRMPGLRYEFIMSPFSNSLNLSGGNMLSRHTGGISREWEMLRSRNVPHTLNQPSEVRRTPQWFQQSKIDSKINFSVTEKRWTSPVVLPDTSYEGEDLQAMVHDFIENDCVEHMDGADGDGDSLELTLSENLQMLTNPHNTRERDLLAHVKRLLLTLYEDTNLICNSNSTNCKKTCMKRFIVRHLKASGYSASVCKSQWPSSGHVPGGEYEYIDVVLEGDRLVDHFLVDINFQTQFEIARPTPQYKAALKSLPIVFVGTIANLEQVLELMSDAAKVSLDQNDMHLPPWRTFDYMRAKWLSKVDRKLDFSISPASRDSSGLRWGNNGNLIHHEARHCHDVVRHFKNSPLLSRVAQDGSIHPEKREKAGSSTAG